MACGSRIARTEHSLVAVTTTSAYKWYTDWIPAIGFDKIKGVLKSKNVQGNFQARWALQTAAVRGDSPDTPTLLESSFMTGANERCSGVLDISSYTAPSFLVRFGVAYSLSSGTTPGMADVSIEGAYDACGRVLGAPTVRLSTPDTGNYYEPLTPFIPAQHVDKVKAAIIVTSASANFESRLAYRTATTAKEGPNVWSTTFDAWHTGAGEFNTGELSPSSASDMWIQLGLQHSMTSGTNGGAIVTVALSTRKT